jgi:hypothetical protein
MINNTGNAASKSADQNPGVNGAWRPHAVAKSHSKANDVSAVKSAKLQAKLLIWCNILPWANSFVGNISENGDSGAFWIIL